MIILNNNTIENKNSRNEFKNIFSVYKRDKMINAKSTKYTDSRSLEAGNKNDDYLVI